MAKKKRRYAKSHHKPLPQPISDIDVHHLLWVKYKWNKHLWSSKLRSHPYLRVPIPRETLHQVIHREVYDIPIPNEILCQQTYEQLNFLYEFGAIRNSDDIIKRLNILIALLECAADDTVKALKEQREIATQFYKGN